MRASSSLSMVHTRAWPRISPSTKIYFFCHFRGLFCNSHQACNVVVWAGPPAGESICSSVPLFLVWEESLTTIISTPLPCQKVTFIIEELSSTNPNLFQIAPSISSDGTLSFITAPTEYGNVVLSARVRDDGLNQG